MTEYPHDEHLCDRCDKPAAEERTNFEGDPLVLCAECAESYDQVVREIEQAGYAAELEARLR